MASEKQDTRKAAPQKTQSPDVQGSKGQNSGMKGVIFGLLAFITALAIIIAVIGGAFYIIIHNNFNGLAEKYRKELQAIPVLKLALPTLPVPPDPDDPKNLTDEELRKKYPEIKSKRDDLENQLREANKKITELQTRVDEIGNIKEEADKTLKNSEEKNAQTEALQKKFADERKKLDEAALKGDKTAFRDYYEKADKEVAKKVYEEILKDQKASDEAKKVTQMYEAMDPAASAKIFEQMGNSKIDLVVDILKSMKKEITAEILAAMDPVFSSKVAERLSKPITVKP